MSSPNTRGSTSHSVPSSSVGSQPSRSGVSSLETLIKVDTGKFELKGSHECTDTPVSLDSFGNHVIIGLTSGLIKVIDLKEFSEVAMMGTDFMPVTRLKCKFKSNKSSVISSSGSSKSDDLEVSELIETNLDALLAATHAGGHLRLWDLNSFTCLGSLTDPSVNNVDYMSLEHSPWVDLVCVGLSSGQLRIIDTNHLSVVSIMEMSNSRFDGLNHDLSVQCIVHHPTHPHEFVSASNDQVLRIWDVRMQNCVRKIRTDMLVVNNGLLFDEDNKTILQSGFNPCQNLALVDYEAGKILKFAKNHNNSSITSMSRVKKSTVITAGCHPGSLCVIDYNKDKVIAEYKDLKSLLDVKVVQSDEEVHHHQGRQRTPRNVVAANQSKLVHLQLTL